MKNSENELKILELISQGKDDISQRDISRIIGMSLGMTNSILKRFAEKGLITIKKVNNRNIHYALTSEGVEEIGRRSWRYFKRTIKNVVVYREAISEIIKKAIEDGYTGISLVGTSDMAFIVEHECYKLQLPFACEEKENYFIFLAEEESPHSDKTERDNCYNLNTLVRV
jgi:DNA-binding MarR family transcriptional regulator